MDGDRRYGGSALQTAGAVTWKLRRPSYVFVEGTSMPWRSAEQTFARPDPISCIIKRFIGRKSRFFSYTTDRRVTDGQTDRRTDGHLAIA